MALSLVVGFPIVFLILAMFAGGIEEAGYLLVLSIICTAGIGLVVWIPVCWLVGWAVMSLIYAMRNISESEASVARIGAKPGVTGPEPAIMRYIHAAKVQGMDEGEITRRLMEAGWSVESIALAASAVS